MNPLTLFNSSFMMEIIMMRFNPQIIKKEQKTDRRSKVHLSAMSLILMSQNLMI